MMRKLMLIRITHYHCGQTQVFVFVCFPLAADDDDDLNLLTFLLEL